MKFVNLTPHVIRLNDGREFQPEPVPARVSAVYGSFDWDGVCRIQYGEITGLPPYHSGKSILYIVSGLVAAAAVDRPDVVSPATGHPEAVRKDGQIYSVPGFVR